MSMKKTMKTTVKIMAAVAVMMGFAFNAMGQNATDNATATANVVSTISVTKAQDLNFGQVSVGVDKSVDIDGTATSTGTVTSSAGVTVGRFKVYAEAGSNVGLQFTTLPTTLAGPSAATMSIKYVEDHAGVAKNFAGYGTAENAGGATRFDPNSATTVGSGTFPTNSLDSKNGIYVFLGGTVEPQGTQTPGSYTANITLTATYN